MKRKYKLRTYQVDEVKVYSERRRCNVECIKGVFCCDRMREDVLYSGWDVCNVLYLKEWLPFQENFAAIVVIVGYHCPPLHNLAGYIFV